MQVERVGRGDLGRAQVVRVRMCRFTGCSRVFEAALGRFEACPGSQGAHVQVHRVLTVVSEDVQPA